MTLPIKSRKEALERSATNLVDAGALLIVVRSGISRRRIPAAINAVAMAINQDVKALRPKVALATSKYLLTLIQGNESALLLQWTKHGATVESVEHELLANSRVPLPPLREQIDIVSFVDDEAANINTTIAFTRRSITLLNELRIRLIADVVTGKLDVREAAARLPEEPEENEEPGE